jgi:hypothetical protein
LSTTGSAPTFCQPSAGWRQKTIESEAIDQTAEPLCAKIAPTEPAISISYRKLAPLYEKIQKDSKEKIRPREFFY